MVKNVKILESTSHGSLESQINKFLNPLNTDGLEIRYSVTAHPNGTNTIYSALIEIG